MPAFSGRACRVAIVGASSLRGKELKQLLDERGFPTMEVRLLDEDVAVGTLTEAGGEPTLIGAVNQDSFERVDLAFFAGSGENTARHFQDALRAGAAVIDLSEPRAELPEALPWVPALDLILPPPKPPQGNVFRSPAAPAIVTCAIAAALAPLSTQRLTMVFFQPVSERGQPGIEELESQTVDLLSFKPISQPVFDVQVAFNMLRGYGEGCDQRLEDIRSAIRADVTAYLAGRLQPPAIQLLQAPVFYSYAFTAHAELTGAADPAVLEAALQTAGIKIQSAEEPPPNNLSVAGESQAVLARVERDPACNSGYWLWGAADNLRLSAANAVSIAEKLIAS